MLVHYENIKNIPGLTCLMLILSGGQALFDRDTFFMEDQEIWRPVVGFEKSYLVSNKGVVKSINRTIIRKNGRKQVWVGKQIVGSLIWNGYRIIGLQDNSVRYTFLAHRLVAIAFIPNPENKPFVNHKDCNKLNNNVDNLEWCTAKENINHAEINNRRYHPTKGNHPMAKKVFDLNSEITFDSIIDFLNHRNIKRTVYKIFLYRNGVQSTEQRFKFKYV